MSNMTNSIHLGLSEKFSDNGEHSHFELFNSNTGEILWSEDVDVPVCDKRFSVTINLLIENILARNIKQPTIS